MSERDCNTCEMHVQGKTNYARGSVCWSCIDLPVTLPNWKPMSKAYDAAFRGEEPMTATKVIEAQSRRVTVGQVATPFGAKKEVSNGATAGYYELPQDAKELQDLISYKNMNAQMGEIFRAVYRYGQVGHSPEIRDIKKIIFYANEELKRLERYVPQSR